MSTTVEKHPEKISVEFSNTNYLRWIGIVGLVYLLLVAVALIGSGFKMAAGNQAKELFAFASNPIAALVVGIIATSIIQSSSTVTSIIVGLVAGGLPVGVAVPMVMGANIGTTLTNTIVSLGHVKKGEEFKRAFSAATIHDFFNIMNVIIFLPLEMVFGILEKLGGFLSSLFVSSNSMSIKGMNFIKPIVTPPVDYLNSSSQGLFPEFLAAIILIIFGVIMIFLVVTFLSRLLKVLMVGKVRNIMNKALGKGPFSSISIGTFITVLVQSSSTTTSLIVPLAGNGVFSLRQIYPFTLGANIGTCITAILAATAVSGVNAIFALQIALIHFLYNVLGVIVIYGIPFLRRIPIIGAEKLSELAVKNKFYIIGYVGSVFFIIPIVMIFLSKIIGW